MQQEKEALEFQKHIDSLDKNIVNLSEDVRQATELKVKQAEKGNLAVETEEPPLPAPVAPLEVDILEEPVESGITEEGAVSEFVMIEPGSVQQTLPIEGFYEKAYALYKNDDYNNAIVEFDSFLAAYPDTDYSDNALYWKGECYYSMGKFAMAINLFEEVVNKYADRNKAPHAQLKTAYSYMELKDKQNAKKAFQQVMDLYPFSDTAKTAADKLNAL